jgi:Flp pilus assembly protein TadG
VESSQQALADQASAQDLRGTRRPGRRPRTRGQALTEFALVLPVFLLVLSGILDFGFLLYSRMTVINAARDGARAAITLIGASTTTTIPTVVDTTVRGDSPGLVTTSPTLTVTTVCIKASGSCAFTVTSPVAATDVTDGDSVRVTVDYTYHSFFPLLFGSAIHLVSTVQMVLE